jgi:hypothetical protein
MWSSDAKPAFLLYPGAMPKRRPPEEKKSPEVLRRAPSERKRLPPDLEAFAGGDEDALWRRPVKRRVNDPRPVMLVPGVANRDARAVYEARERRLRAALKQADRDAASLELAEAARMQVWRGHSVVGWEVFVEDVLGISREEATQLRERGAALSGSSEPASEDVVAVWMRAEAGLLESSPDACVRLRGAPGAERLVLEVPIHDAAAALSNVGRRATPVAREHANQPSSEVYRPKGVPRPKRERRDDD